MSYALNLFKRPSNMNIIYPESTKNWSAVQKILFRFLFIYLTLYIAPITWFAEIPALNKMAERWYSINDCAVNYANTNLFHVRAELMPLNGSGDTSFAWAQLCFYLALSVAGCMLWTVFDFKRVQYNALYYWLCLFTRYNLIFYCFLYGITKLFLQQMAVPGYSQLSTPLGDFSSQRLLWMFMGHSEPYQFFTGALEVIAGLLLLFRRTSSAGIFAATGIFLNISVLNLCYNIPVKLLSIHLFLMCVFLLAADFKRYLSFFFSNKVVPPGNLYNAVWASPFWQATRYILKIIFILLFCVFTAYTEYGGYTESSNIIPTSPFKPGVYDIHRFAINKDSLPLVISGSARWNHIAFDVNGQGSIDKVDSNFTLKYNRSYFYFKPDTIKHILNLTQFTGDTVISFKYQVADSGIIKLYGLYNNDSLYLEIEKRKNDFQLRQKAFQWLSEGSH